MHDDVPGMETGRRPRRVEAADLLGSVVLDQYGIAASTEFTDMRALDISY